MADNGAAAEKEYNRLLNLWDPPKDLISSSWVGFEDSHKEQLKAILKELFSPNVALPDSYTSISDTKKKIKDYFGYDDVPGKPYSTFITDKINTLVIIRECHSSGQDPRPTGLYVSQDTGPNDVVTKPKFIITPGTLLDPASKTKDATATFDPITNYGSLPTAYIKMLYLDTVINGEITATKNERNTEFTVTIPTTIGAITTNLNATFQPASDAGDGAYFKGNPTKNSFILANRTNLTDATIRKQVKKYLLVKELGDTLQVQWLNYIFDTALGKGDPYTRGNTVIITNDTVVLYRSLVNKVPVILTYMGKTRFFKSTSDDPVTKAAIEAAMIQTIRDETIRHNLSVIKVITDVIVKGDGDNDPWIGGTLWYKAPLKRDAKAYLTKLARLLETMNKDFDVYLSALPNAGAAKDFAARSHFICPFVWCKGGYYKQVTTVTHLLPENKLNFPAASFTALSVTQVKLTNGTFVNVGPLQGGGGRQRGGVRKTIGDKKALATAATTPAEIQALITQSITDWLVPWTEAAYTITPRITSEVVRNPSSTDTIRGDATKIEEFGKWSINVNGVTKESLKAKNYFLYWYVREFYPQIFTYAYVFKKAIVKTRADSPALIAELDREVSNAEAARNAASNTAERVEARERQSEATRATQANEFAERALAEYKNVPHTENLLTKYTVEGRFNSDNGFLYEKHAEAGAVEAAFNGTYEAISLAEYFVDIFPQLQTLHLANFFSKIRSASYGVKKFEEVVGVFVPIGEDFGQLGGGVEPINPLVENAMDVYELYYSLYVQAAYEDRDVTDKEFQAALLKVEEKLISTAVLSSPLRIKEKPPTTPGISSNQLKRIQMKTRTPLIVSPIMPQRLVFAGGKSRYRKTQKKRKSSRKQTKRKTRRHKK
jgi:hypothetical protein